MATPSSRPRASKPADASTRRRNQNIIGAVAGAVIGGVLGAFAVKKVRDGSVKRLIPAKVPAAAKRAAGVAKGIAHDAKLAAKATAVSAADAALQEVTTGATQFVVDTVSGQKRTPPGAPVPTPDATHTPAAQSDQPAAPRGVTVTAKVKARKKPAAPKKSRATKKRTKPAKARRPS